MVHTTQLASQSAPNIFLSTTPQSLGTSLTQISPLRQRMIRDMELAGLSPGTQRVYLCAIVALQTYYKTRPDQLIESQVYDYVLWMRDKKGVPKGTFQVHWNGIKFFYYRCLCNDWALFSRKKVRQPLRFRLPTFLTCQDALRLISAIRHPGYRLCYKLMFCLGMRFSEALNLTVKSISKENRIIRLIGKRNKERILPLPETLRQELLAYWLTHRHQQFIFPNKEGTAPLCEQSMRVAFTAARDEQQFGKEITPHTLRHSFATHLLQERVDIRIVQVLLGHASLASTEIYTHMTKPIHDDLRGRIDAMLHNNIVGGRL
jgi:integrase/recombinase XerD